MAKLLYYRHDGAYYRRPSDAPGVGVRDVLHGQKWVPYNGEDLIEPVVFGSEVDEAEVTKAMNEAGAKAVAA